MQFKTTSTVDKKLWSNPDNTSFMYAVIEGGNTPRKWTVFSQQELTTGSLYDLEGYVSQSKDKKRTGSDGRDIYLTNFNVESATLNESIPF